MATPVAATRYRQISIQIKCAADRIHHKAVVDDVVIRPIGAHASTARQPS
jgi:hypothetical protein